MVNENHYAAPLLHLYMCAKQLLHHEKILVAYWTAVPKSGWRDIKTITYSGAVLAKDLPGRFAQTPWKPVTSKTRQPYDPGNRCYAVLWFYMWELTRSRGGKTWPSAQKACHDRWESMTKKPISARGMEKIGDVWEYVLGQCYLAPSSCKVHDELWNSISDVTFWLLRIMNFILSDHCPAQVDHFLHIRDLEPANLAKLLLAAYWMRRAKDSEIDCRFYEWLIGANICFEPVR